MLSKFFLRDSTIFLLELTLLTLKRLLFSDDEGRTELLLRTPS